MGLSAMQPLSDKETDNGMKGFSSCTLNISSAPPSIFKNPKLSFDHLTP